jgi:hypothetical protein
MNNKRISLNVTKSKPRVNSRGFKKPAATAVSKARFAFALCAVIGVIEASLRCP